MSSSLRSSPSPSPNRQSFFDEDSTDGETASQHSIALSSRPVTPVEDNDERSEKVKENIVETSHDLRTPVLGTKATVAGSTSSAGQPIAHPLSQKISSSSSLYDPGPSSIKYPPPPIRLDSDVASMTSVSSTSSRKTRPESMLLELPKGPIVPGIALVDFNHLVGPRIEFSEGEIFEDEEIAKILPFLALPDGAHLSSEDYSYFHVVPSSPHPTTLFGISCNRQIRSDELLVKDSDVTRSTVQKAVVVLAAKPLFGPIRDKLGVVTQALFEQRDFRETDILVDFHSSLELSLPSQLTESGLYIGTNLRELVHTFRIRTLLILKAFILQKRIMFYGHPVERLCTYQYSLISLIPGLLQNLDDCGSPPLATRAPSLSRATSLRTSDRKSLLTYLGLPLDLFGKDAFFQPYLPLQQIDILKETRSWVCGSTNAIVTQQKEVDLLVNIETSTVEFRDPKLERLVALTAADRKWMDDVVKDVNDEWHDSSPGHVKGFQFKGSEDYLRSKFEEYITSALASVKYADFLVRGQRQDVTIIGSSDGGDPNAIMDFNPLWISEFRHTNAYEVWNRITDPLLFDIIEARHPCSEKPNAVVDLGLRLQEGLQDLKLEQQLAPTREAINRTITSGSMSFFKAVEGVRERWASSRVPSSSPLNDKSRSTSGTPIEITQAEVDMATKDKDVKTSNDDIAQAASPPIILQQTTTNLKPLSLVAAQAASDTRATLNSWGSGIGSFLSQRASRFSLPRADSVIPTSPMRDMGPAGVIADHSIPAQSEKILQKNMQSIDEATDLQQETKYSEIEQDMEFHTMPRSSISTDSFVSPGTAL